MRASLLTVAVVLHILAVRLDAQEQVRPVFDQVRGIVNRYLEVTEVIPCLRTVRVADSPSVLSIGDRVVLIQMQGARITETDDSTHGAIVDLNGAGSVEYLVVERVDRDSVIFTTPWVHTYDVAGRVQLVRVSRHVDAQIVGTVEPLPWNGRIGGVVAIDVDKTLSLDADISATGRGFRGGQVSVRKDLCNGRIWKASYASGDGGQKGEGLASNVTGLDVCAKGASANGGGGGNGANAGGAGGGGGGNGGHGGDASSLCDPYIGSGGRSGFGMSARIAEQRLFMGGGGGGGHQNNDQGTSGATGGGIVLVRAEMIVVTTGTLLSQGETVRDTSAWRNGVALQPGDGTGGGGAGGSIMVEADRIVGNLTVNVRGGNGGNVGARYQPNGPGGGGGGGIVLIPKPHSNITVLAAGGRPGVHVSFETGPNVFRRPWGATAGDSGAVVTPFVWKIPTNPILSVTGADTVCDGTLVELTASEGFAAYRWSTGESGRRISVRNAGRYTVTVTDSAGCVRSPVPVDIGVRSVRVDVDPAVNFGTTEVGVNLRSFFVIRNVSSEPIKISDISLPTDVLLTGVSAPLVIPAADSIRVDLEFVSARVMSLRDSIRLSVTEPCTATETISVSADVTADRVVFMLPEVRAERPSEGVSIPIQARLETFTPDIRGVGLRLVVGIDARLFDVSNATNAQIVGTSIDRDRSLRLIELSLASVDVTQTPAVLCELSGISLLAGVFECPITIEQVSWERPFGGPASRVDTGRLTVGMPCGSARRAVQFLSGALFSVSPNPAVDHITVLLDPLLTSTVSWSIMNVLGERIGHGQASASEHQIVLPVTDLPCGRYLLRLVTAQGVVAIPLGIQR